MSHQLGRQEGSARSLHRSVAERRSRLLPENARAKATGAVVKSSAQDARAEADHETLTALHQMSIQQIDILEGQNQILDLLGQKAR